MGEQLELLRRDVALKHASVVAAREVLIEALGERMCGGGSGPSAEETRAFELAQQVEAEAKEELQRYLVARSQEVIEQARRAGTERPSATVGQHRGGNDKRRRRRQTVMNRQPERGRPD